MKYLKKQFIWFGIIALLSVVIFVITISPNYNNDFGSGFAIGLFAVSVIKIIQYVLMLRNEEQLKKFEINNSEERIIMLADKSGRFTLLLSIAVQCIVGIILLVLGNDTISTMLLYTAGASSFLYVIVYFILSKKY